MSCERAGAAAGGQRARGGPGRRSAARGRSRRASGSSGGTKTRARRPRSRAGWGCRPAPARSRRARPPAPTGRTARSGPAGVDRGAAEPGARAPAGESRPSRRVWCGRISPPSGWWFSPATKTGQGRRGATASSAARFLASSQRRPAAKTMRLLGRRAERPGVAAVGDHAVARQRRRSARASAASIACDGATTRSAAREAGGHLRGGSGPSSGGAASPLTACHQESTQEWPTITIGRVPGQRAVGVAVEVDEVGADAAPRGRAAIAGLLDVAQGSSIHSSLKRALEHLEAGDAVRLLALQVVQAGRPWSPAPLRRRARRGRAPVRRRRSRRRRRYPRSSGPCGAVEGSRSCGPLLGPRQMLRASTLSKIRAVRGRRLEPSAGGPPGPPSGGLRSVGFRHRGSLHRAGGEAAVLQQPVVKLADALPRVYTRAPAGRRREPGVSET